MTELGSKRETITDPKDIGFLKELETTPVLHIFGSGFPYCEMALGVSEYHPTRRGRKKGEEVIIISKTYYSPGISKDGREFLAILVKSGLATSNRLNQIFKDPQPNLDLEYAGSIKPSKWPESKSVKGVKGWAKLAEILGKEGVQFYNWDRDMGNKGESWKTDFIKANGEVISNEQV